MESKKAIVIYMIVVFVIATSLVYVINDIHRPLHTAEGVREKWIEQHVDSNEKKIYLLGASHVRAINASEIKKIISEKDYNYEVYNLSSAGHNLNKQFLWVNEIISTNPDIVVLAIPYADLLNSPFIKNQEFNKHESVLPNFKSNIGTIGEKIDTNFFGINFGNFKNPQFTVLQIFNLMSGEKIDEYNINSVEPFIPLEGIPTPPNNYDIIKQLQTHPAFIDGIPDSYEKLGHMEEMVKQFRTAGIDIIIFVVPHHEVHWQIVGQTNEAQFISMIRNSENKIGIKIYDMHDMYFDKNIWVDTVHITRNSDSLIFTEDIAKIILQELEK